MIASFVLAIITIAIHFLALYSGAYDDSTKKGWGFAAHLICLCFAALTGYFAWIAVPAPSWPWWVMTCVLLVATVTLAMSGRSSDISTWHAAIPFFTGACLLVLFAV